ncbi:glycoside hydrolase [Streptomyces cinnabarinus]|uniref:Glycoside hydrolase n=1 Tax=Streptomyces cinnabarinus TaxID=67287 RepID=A0ABY7KP65_9ACTN|nr:sialidase family protein [Streptomyces cinnabarinus]WAZ26368.1 glycoside hydrolase [Streptomyces cinnabarinus]
MMPVPDSYLDATALNGTPEAAYASHRERALGIARHYAHTHPLGDFDQADGREFDENVATALIAHLHAAAADPAFAAPGAEPSRTLIPKVLRRWHPGKGEVGTKRDYDIALKGLMTAVCRYPDLFAAEDHDFILDTLIPGHMSGGHRPEIEIYEVTFLNIDVPETENHLLMIESCRYLYNQLLHDRNPEVQYDNEKNGLRDWLLGYLQRIAQHDFLEFNSRPYARLALHPLFNLYEFARDDRIRSAARILLDYTMVKYAVSSNRVRRVSPFRRQQHRINHTANDRNDLLSNFGDQVTGMFAACTGFVDPAGNPARFPASLTDNALIAGTSSYRPPAAAYLIALDRTTPPALHRFFHGSRPRLTASPDDADGGLEIYYHSPSFLLTAGGNFLNSGYGNDEFDIGVNSWEQTSRAQATTLIPTGADVAYADLIRFEPWPDLQLDPYAVNRYDPDEDPFAERMSSVNLGVHRGIMAGANLRPAEKKTVEEQSSSHAPAVCEHKGRLYVAWKGSGNENISVATAQTTTLMGMDGVEGLQGVVTHGFTTEVAPAIASQDGLLYLAWKGAGNNQLNLAVSADDGRTFSSATTLGDHSDMAPALAAHNGRVHLAWTGEGEQQLNVARVVLIGSTAGTYDIEGIEQKTVLGDTSDGAPALTSCSGRLFLGWRGSGNEDLNLAFSDDDGRTFHGKHIFAETSARGPALTTHDDLLYLGWRGSGNENLNVARVGLYASTAGDFGIDGIASKVSLPEISTQPPALASAAGLLHLAWKGEGADHLNLRITRDGSFTAPGPWIFADLSHLGIHLAVYRAPAAPVPVPPTPPFLPALDTLGFVYAAESAAGAFDDFRTRILQANTHLPATLEHGSSHVFQAPDGTRFRIWFSHQDRKYRARITDESGDIPDLDTLPLASGEFLRADGHTGKLEIHTPGCDAPLVLDYRTALDPQRTGKPACTTWYDRLWAAYADLAIDRLRKGRTTIALSLTHEILDEFRQARLHTPELAAAGLSTAAEKFHAVARAAHPTDVPLQLAAAQNAWQIYQILATEQPPAPDLASRVANLPGYLAYGTPVIADATAAAALARALYARLPGDHTLDIAAVWTNQALLHHEAAFRPGNPDQPAELAHQREAAAEALTLLDPLVAATPPAPDLTRMAPLLYRLIGVASFGSPDSGPSVHAADLLRRVYAALGGDHRLDLAEALTALSQRHHETSFVGGTPDPAAEQTRQRDTAAEATPLILALSETLPAGPPTDRTRATTLLDRLIGLLLFGAPSPPDPRTLELQALADAATDLRDTLRTPT